MNDPRYEFIDAPDDDGSVKIFDNFLEQRVLNLPKAVAMKTAIMYMNLAETQSQDVADQWMNGYCIGSADTELILKGLV